MTLTPPTSPDPIWITLADGSEVLGYWDSHTGYRIIDDDAVDMAPPEAFHDTWCLALLDPVPHDVISWRPLMPEGEVSWQVEVLVGGVWRHWAGPRDTYEKAAAIRETSKTRDSVQDTRIVKVIRIVQPEGESP